MKNSNLGPNWFLTHVPAPGSERAYEPLPSDADAQERPGDLCGLGGEFDTGAPAPGHPRGVRARAGAHRAGGAVTWYLYRYTPRAVELVAIVTDQAMASAWVSRRARGEMRRAVRSDWI